MKPIRIQRKRTKGYKMPKNTIYVGRPTKWRNPFKVGKRTPAWEKTFIAIQLCKKNFIVPGDIKVIYKTGIFDKPITLKQSIQWYRIWLKFQIEAKNLNVKDLRGKNLACWCKPGEPCHADILLKLANK